MKRKVKIRNTARVNKGFTLIELLVAITILALVIIPMSQVFIQASKKNAEAKRKQNANVVAQNVMETYKYYSMDEIKLLHNIVSGMNAEIGVIEQSDTDLDGLKDKFVLESILEGTTDSEGHYYMEGASGEDFYVRVTIDPSEYAQDGFVNSYKIPNMSDLYDGNNVVVQEETGKYDEVAATRLGTTKENVVKTTNVLITTTIIKPDLAGDPVKYRTSVSVETIYVGNGQTFRTRHFITAKTFSIENEEIPDVYVLYDRYNDDEQSTDVINVRHEYTSDSLPASYEQMPINVYLVETGEEQKVQGNNVNCVSVDVDGFAFVKGDYFINLHTNIEGAGKGVTESENTENTLYTITVEVRRDSYDGEIVATMKSAKERDYGK